MENQEHKKSKDWYFPPDLAVALSPFVGVLLLLLATCGIPWVTGMSLFRLAIILGGIGVALLFVARIPVYREKRFFSFGPSAIRGFYRKIYFAAYVFIVPSILFLIFALLFLRHKATPL
jgi:hypothetical protein